MRVTRRDLSFLLPALAASANAQRGPRPALTSTVFHNDKIPYAGDDRKKGRRFFYGSNHTGFNFEMHETILGEGVQTHPPHKHLHEEVMTVLEGTAEVYFDGKTEPAETGSVIYYQSNQMHTIRNVGKGRLRYYVIEVRGDEG